MPDVVPTIQAQKDWENMAKLQQERAKANITENAEVTEYSNSENEDQDISLPQTEVRFPWGAFILAILFDIPGFIPGVDIICLLTDPIAAVLFGFWQKRYQETDLFTVIVNAIAWKGADALTIGFLPSNASLVFRAYTKKKIKKKISITA